MFEIIPASYIWWIIGLILFILEMVTPTTIFIFPAIAAVLTGLISLILHNLIIESILFFSISVFFIFMIRPLWKKNKTQESYKSGVDALIGMKLRVVETINPLTEEGKVKHASDIFPAKSIENNIIPKDAFVIVKKIDGIKLLVVESK